MRNAIIRGQRVYLRPLEIEDARLIAEASHQETDAFIDRGRDLQSPIAAEAVARSESGSVPEAIVFAICLVEDDRCIGLVDLDEIDLVNGIASTGSLIHNPAYRGKGYGTEAKHLLLEYSFDRLHLERVISSVFEPNTRSAAALKKQGYQPAGRLKYHNLKDGRYQDMLMFDLTRDEWLRARG